MLPCARPCRCRRLCGCIPSCGWVLCGCSRAFGWWVQRRHPFHVMAATAWLLWWAATRSLSLNGADGFDHDVDIMPMPMPRSICFRTDSCTVPRGSATIASPWTVYSPVHVDACCCAHPCLFFPSPHSSFLFHIRIILLTSTTQSEGCAHG